MRAWLQKHSTVLAGRGLALALSVVSLQCLRADCVDTDISACSGFLTLTALYEALGLTGVYGVLSVTPSDAAVNVEPANGTVSIFFRSIMDTGRTLSVSVEAIEGGVPRTLDSSSARITWPDARTLVIDFGWRQFPEILTLRWRLAADGLATRAGNAADADITGTFTTSMSTVVRPLSDTGQLQCSSGALGDGAFVGCPATITGQDGDYLNTPNARNFQASVAHPTFTNDYTVTDDLTGRVWKTCSEGLSGPTCLVGAPQNFTWYQALNACSALNTANSGAGYAGRTDWRLPFLAELNSIVQFGPGPPADAVFPNHPAANFWTATALVNTNNQAWVIAFASGDQTLSTRTTAERVRCVAGGGPSAGRDFVDLGDGTVRDNARNLVWLQCPVGLSGVGCVIGVATSGSWSAAVASCEALVFAGRTNWRMPNAFEMRSLVDLTHSNPAIDTSLFPNTPTAVPYWTSTTSTGVVSDAARIDFTLGDAGYFNKPGPNFHRCVAPGP